MPGESARCPEVKLHARIILLLALTFGMFLSAGFGIVHLVLNPAFERLEQAQAVTNVKRVQRALQNQLASIDQKLSDWSNWDDTNDFVRHRTASYIEGNLNASSLANLNISFMAFYNLEGKPVWIGSHDPDSGEIVALPEMSDPDAAGTFSSTADRAVEKSGLWVAGSSAFLVAARPILNSQSEGPIAGTLIFGQRLDDGFVAGLREQTEVAFHLDELPPDLVALPDERDEPRETGRTERILEHSVSWRDLAGAPRLRIMVETPRDITAVGRNTIRLASIFLVSAALIDMTVIGLAVVFLIARPVRVLIAQVRRIASSGNLSLRLDWNRRDEIGILATQFDRMIEELELSSNRAMAASQAKSHFLANMSHELRTPLNAMIGFSNIIATEMMGPVGNARYVEYAADIHASARHLLDLIVDILDFSKIEAGKMQVHEDRVNLAEVLSFCRSQVELRAGQAGITIQVRPDSTLPAVHADSRKLKQAIINLLTNAIKFSPRGGTVTLQASVRPNGLAIAVSDQGIGMAPDQIALALEPFGQLENGFAKSREGTGLGLSLTRSLIALHGGDLTLESALGQGTTATILLPPTRFADEPEDKATGLTLPQPA